MPALAPPPYQSAAGSLQWHAWYRQINNLLEGISLSVGEIDDITLTPPFSDKELFVYDSGSAMWINQTLDEFHPVLQDVATLGISASDGEFIVATGAGAFSYESGVTARASMGVTIGTDVLAQQAIGIADNNLLEVDDTPSALEYARFTASGLEGRTEAEFKADFNLEASDLAKVYRLGHTYAISGEIKVPSGDTNFIIPFFVSLAAGQTAVLSKVRYQINSGTDVTADVEINGSGAAGFTGITVTTTAAETDPSDVALSNNDLIAVVVTAVSGTPTNMSFTLFIEMTQ